MSGPAAETNETSTPAARAPARLAIGRDLLRAASAVALIVVGGVSLASNLGLLVPEDQRAVAARFAWPASLVLVGLGLILARDRLGAGEAVRFTVEQGEAELADLMASAGTADLRLEASSAAGELAAVELPPPKKPRVERRDGRATVKLEPLWGLPEWGGARWTAALAQGLPWRLNLRSSTGNLDLNLADLSVTEARLRSTFGDVDLTLPSAGGIDLDIGLAFGDLTLRVPEGLGVRVKLYKGALTEVAHDERRFVHLPNDEIETALYATAARRCVLTVRLGAGDLNLM